MKSRKSWLLVKFVKVRQCSSKFAAIPSLDFARSSEQKFMLKITIMNSNFENAHIESMRKFCRYSSLRCFLKVFEHLKSKHALHSIYFVLATIRSSSSFQRIGRDLFLPYALLAPQFLELCPVDLILSVQTSKLIPISVSPWRRFALS